MEKEFEIFRELVEIKNSKDYGSEIFYFLELPNSNYTGIAVITFQPGITRVLDVTTTALNLFDIRMIINMGFVGGIFNTTLIFDTTLIQKQNPRIVKITHINLNQF